MSEVKRRFIFKAQVVLWVNGNSTIFQSWLLCGYFYFKVLVIFILWKFVSLVVVLRRKSLEKWSLKWKQAVSLTGEVKMQVPFACKSSYDWQLYFMWELDWWLQKVLNVALQGADLVLRRTHIVIRGCCVHKTVDFLEHRRECLSKHMCLYFCLLYSATL